MANERGWNPKETVIKGLLEIPKNPGIRFLRIPGLEFLKILGSRDLVGAWLLFTIFVFWMLLEIYKFLISNRIFIITVLKRTPPQMFFATLLILTPKCQTTRYKDILGRPSFTGFPSGPGSSGEIKHVSATKVLIKTSTC